jgi:hypothetical protein
MHIRKIEIAEVPLLSRRQSRDGLYVPSLKNLTTTDLPQPNTSKLQAIELF